MFAVKLVNFLMFTVSEEITVKCWEGSSDIFGNSRTSSLVFENLRKSSGMVGSLRKSCELVNPEQERITGLLGTTDLREDLKITLEGLRWV